MKECLNLWVGFPALRKIEESIVGIRMQVADLVEIPFLLEHILVHKSGIGIDDCQFLDGYLGSAWWNFVGFSYVLHLVVIKIINDVVIANVSARQAV